MKMTTAERQTRYALGEGREALRIQVKDRLIADAHQRRQELATTKSLVEHLIPGLGVGILLEEIREGYKALETRLREDTDD